MVIPFMYIEYRIPDGLKKARGPCQTKAPQILMSVVIVEFAINIVETLSSFVTGSVKRSLGKISKLP
jgi:hypothetical protein